MFLGSLNRNMPSGNTYYCIIIYVYTVTGFNIYFSMAILEYTDNDPSQASIFEQSLSSSPNIFNVLTHIERVYIWWFNLWQMTAWYYLAISVTGQKNSWLYLVSW